MKVAVLGLGLVVSAVMAAAQPAEELGGDEVGTAVHVWGTVKTCYRCSSDDWQGRPELGMQEAIRLYWNLKSYEDSELVMKFVPGRTCLLMGPESELFLEPHPNATKECGLGKITCLAACRLHLTRARVDFCELTVETTDLAAEAKGTDFAVLAHPLYGTMVEVFEGGMEITVGADVFSLSAGGLILVRDGRTWLGAAVAEEAAPMQRFDESPFPDPPALTPEQLFSRDPDIGLPE